MSLATPPRSSSRAQKKSSRSSVKVKSAIAKTKNSKSKKNSGASKSIVKKSPGAKAGKLIYFFAAKGTEGSADRQAEIAARALAYILFVAGKMNREPKAATPQSPRQNLLGLHALHIARDLGGDCFLMRWIE